MDPLTLFITIVLPYISVFTLAVGIPYRILMWLKVPAPFKFPQTPAPTTLSGVAVRVGSDVLLFRSLLKGMRKLWLGSWTFHVSLWGIILYKALLYAPPILTAPTGRVIDIGPSVQTVLVTTVVSYLGIFLLAFLLFLLFRRLILPNLRYISKFADYSILLLLAGIAFTGIYMRSYEVISSEEVVAFLVGLGSLNPTPPPSNLTFILHFVLVQTLFIYIPFSKIMHMTGVILNPTRNQRNNARAKRYVNPWNDEAAAEIVPWETYYEKFRKELEELGPGGERR